MEAAPDRPIPTRRWLEALSLSSLAGKKSWGRSNRISPSWLLIDELLPYPSGTLALFLIDFCLRCGIAGLVLSSD